MTKDELLVALLNDEQSGDDVLSAYNAAEAAGVPIKERVQFLEAVEWFRGAYADVLSDDSRYQVAVDVESALAQHPKGSQLSYRERLRIAGDEARKIEDPRQRDNKLAIDEMAKHRRRFGESFEERDDTDVEGAVAGYETHLTIEQMAQERRGKNLADMQAQRRREVDARRADYGGS